MKYLYPWPLLLVAVMSGAWLFPNSAHARRRGVKQNYWHLWSHATTVAKMRISQATDVPEGALLVAELVSTFRGTPGSQETFLADPSAIG